MWWQAPHASWQRGCNLSLGEDLLGPDRPHVGYVQLLHIRKILLKIDSSRSASEVRQMLSAYRDGLIALPQFRNVTLYFDVDPV